MKRFVLFLLLSLALCVPVWADDVPPDDIAPPAASDALEPPPDVLPGEGEELPVAPDQAPLEGSPAPTEASPEPDSTPEPSPEPSPEPTPAPHLFWDTPFSDYTVTEGLLLLLFVFFSLCIVFVVFK